MASWHVRGLKRCSLVSIVYVQAGVLRLTGVRPVWRPICLLKLADIIDLMHLIGLWLSLLRILTRLTAWMRLVIMDVMVLGYWWGSFMLWVKLPFALVGTILSGMLASVYVPRLRRVTLLLLIIMRLLMFEVVVLL